MSAAPSTAQAALVPAGAEKPLAQTKPVRAKRIQPPAPQATPQTAAGAVHGARSNAAQRSARVEEQRSASQGSAAGGAGRTPAATPTGSIRAVHFAGVESVDGHSAAGSSRPAREPRPAPPRERAWARAGDVGTFTAEPHILPWLLAVKAAEKKKAEPTAIRRIVADHTRRAFEECGLADWVDAADIAGLLDYRVVMDASGGALLKGKTSKTFKSAAAGLREILTEQAVLDAVSAEAEHLPTVKPQDLTDAAFARLAAALREHAVEAHMAISSAQRRDDILVNTLPASTGSEVPPVEAAKHWPPRPSAGKEKSPFDVDEDDPEEETLSASAKAWRAVARMNNHRATADRAWATVVQFWTEKVGRAAEAESIAKWLLSASVPVTAVLSGHARELRRPGEAREVAMQGLADYLTFYKQHGMSDETDLYVSPRSGHCLVRHPDLEELRDFVVQAAATAEEITASVAEALAPTPTKRRTENTDASDDSTPPGEFGAARDRRREERDGPRESPRLRERADAARRRASEAAKAAEEANKEAAAAAEEVAKAAELNAHAGMDVERARGALHDARGALRAAEKVREAAHRRAGDPLTLEDLLKVVQTALRPAASANADADTREKKESDEIIASRCAAVVRVMHNGTPPSLLVTPVQADVALAWRRLTAQCPSLPRTDELSLISQATVSYKERKTTKIYHHKRAASASAEAALLESYVNVCCWAGAHPLTEQYRESECDLAAAVPGEPRAGGDGLEEGEEPDDEPEPDMVMFIAAAGCGQRFLQVARATTREHGLDRDAARKEAAGFNDAIINQLSSSIQRQRISLTAALEAAEEAMPNTVARFVPKSTTSTSFSYQRSERSKFSFQHSSFDGGGSSAADEEEGGLCFAWADKQVQKPGAKGCRFAPEECKYRHIFVAGKQTYS